ncbi:MAG: hypothetical protein KAT47_00965, partial [Candidatus Aegiribacteria sp.]|nr:hypothetical protein [Candidatus Aegiribacteria sp.]
MAVLMNEFRYLLRIAEKSVMLSLIVLLISALQVFAQIEHEEIAGASWVEGRLVLEEITIRGELRTPQALFMMLKATPDLSNVLL